MKIVIVGPGAMGLLFGAFFLRSGEDVYFLDKDKKRAKILRRKGICVEGLSNFVIEEIKVTTEVKEIGKADLIIITTKSYSTESAIKSVLPILDEYISILTLQNGLGNVEIISRYVPQKQIIAGVTGEGATLIDIGYIRHAGRGETIIGAISKIKNQKLKLKDIAGLFNRAGFQTKITSDVEGLLWSKLIVNVGINALTAITRLNNGRLLEFPFTRKIMREVVKEAYRVAKKKKIKLLYPNPIEKVEEVCRKTYGNISSMLQDVLKKKKTEIDFINGAIVKEGERLGISTPINAILTDLVKTIESSYHLQVN